MVEPALVFRAVDEFSIICENKQCRRSGRDRRRIMRRRSGGRVRSSTPDAAILLGSIHMDILSNLEMRQPR